MNKRKHSLAARIFGYFLVIASIAVLTLACVEMYKRISRIDSQAVVPHLTQVAPIDPAWNWDLPNSLIDPRNIQSWTLKDGNLAVLVDGTDGKKTTQILAKIDPHDGKTSWIIDPQPYLDYCLPQLWQDKLICESKNAKKLVTINTDGQVNAEQTPYWDSATGEHVLGGVIDQFLALPLGVSEGNAAGTHVMYLNPDYSYKGRLPIMVTGANAAQPLNTQIRGSLTLSGTHTSDGQQERYTWAYAMMLNTKIGTLDTSALGPTPQASLLDVGIVASADPENLPMPTTPPKSNTQTTENPQIPWQLYKADGSLMAQGSASAVILQAIHSQSRQGRFISPESALEILQTGKVPHVLGDQRILTTSDLSQCSSWPACMAKNWLTDSGVPLNLQIPGQPLVQNANTAVFKQANGLAAVGIADGKDLWSGIVPPVEGAVATREITTLGDRMVTLTQIGSSQDPKSHARVTAWKLPEE